MNIRDTVYFVGSTNVPVGAVVVALSDNKAFCKPINNQSINAFWIMQRDLSTDLDWIINLCNNKHAQTLKSAVKRLAFAEGKDKAKKYKEYFAQ